MSCGGEQDYDGEGGDEVLFMCGGIQRAEGHMGFDWAVHRGDPLPANTDMSFTVAETGVPAVNNNRDRMDRVEGLSGWNFNDILRGDDRATLGVVDPERDLTGHELDAEGIARISGLAALLPVGPTSFTGGNIILGGAGSDLIEGRGGNDILDGDRWLDAQLQAPNLATPDPTDTALFDTLDTLLRLDAVNGRLDPGAISIVRQVKTPSQAQIDASTDVALFSDVVANYDINQNGNGSITVVHARPDPAVADDGTDTLWNIEIARFPDTECRTSARVNRGGLQQPGHRHRDAQQHVAGRGPAAHGQRGRQRPRRPGEPGPYLQVATSRSMGTGRAPVCSVPRSRRRTPGSVTNCGWSSPSSTASVSPSRSRVIPRSLSRT